MKRRQFLRLAAAGWGMQALPLMAGPTAGYQRANTDWLARCRYGIGVHWTAQTVPERGDPLPFAQAVAGFKLREFVRQVREAGADYVLFTAAHALQMLPLPHAVLDRLLPGRTSERDLIGEMADALGAVGIPLLVYYNHSCNGRDDRPWRKAVGYDGADKARFAQNLMEIVAWMGERYRERVKAWWFDSSYSLDPRGPHNSVTTELAGFQFPWEQFTVAAKAGDPGRLVTYNAGIGQTYLYTTHQDYWAGELVDLKTPATARYLPSGLQWFGWTCLEDRRWVHSRRNTAVPTPLYPDEQLAAYVRTCHARQAPMTFNVIVFQDGTLAPASIAQLRRLGASLRG